MLNSGRHPLHIDGRGAMWIDAARFTLSSTAQRFENWEFPYALVLGLGRAAEYAMDVGLPAASARALQLADIARFRLRELPGVRVLDAGTRLGAIVTRAWLDTMPTSSWNVCANAASTPAL